MINKVKNWLALRKQAKAENVQLQQLKKYYELIREGAEFIKFIQIDLKKNSDACNRHQRRRFQKTIMKGEITEELVNYYKGQINRILKEIDMKLNPPKTTDGAKFYEELKKKEGK